MRICVYTYLLGSYDRLLEQPAAADSGADFICFTDDETLTSDSWQIRVVEPRYPTDLVRSARTLKIIGHPSLAEYDVTLCVDASVLLHSTPEKIIDAWLTDDVDMALPQHSFREQVLDEFDEVIRLNYDDPGRIHEQLLAYSVSDPESLTQKPLWTAIMVRRNLPAVADAMRLWMDHVLRYSRRDQLSVNAALSRSGVRVRRIELDNFSSEHHRWPAIEGRRISLGKATPGGSGPLLAELRRARRQIAELERSMSSLGIGSIADLNDELRDMRDKLAAGEAAVTRAEDATRELVQWRERWAAAQGVSGATANLLRATKSALSRRGR